MVRTTRSALARPATAVAALGCATALIAGCAPASTAGDTGGVSGLAPAAQVELVPVAATVALAAPTASASARAGLRAGKVRAYGDSVMLGAASALRSRLHAKVNAAVARQSYELLPLVRRDWTRGRIHGPVVIHTGTNGGIDESQLRRTIRPIQKKHLVLLVNAKVNRSWVPGNNATIARVDRKWRNVIELDWHKLASRHPAWLSGYHLNALGAKKYANLVAKRLGR